MAGADYDGIGGLLRVAERGEELDTFAIEVLTFHAAVEHELEVVLRELLPNPEMILRGKPRLSFAHKSKLLCALWRKDPADAAKLNGVLKAFQDLRDEVAHQGTKSLKTHKANLTQAFRAIEPSAEDDPPMLEIAQGICMFLADGAGTLDDFKSGLAALDKLANDSFPRGFGALLPRKA